MERSLELGLDEDTESHPNAIAFEERLANAEAAGAVTMAELVRDTLRMNPSRVIVGEVLGDEVVTMLNAMTQGNDGSLSTIHCNSSADVVNKIGTYAIQAPERLPWEATVRLVASALDFIVFIRRRRRGEGQRRVIESVREVAGVTEDGQLATNELWGVNDLGEVVRSHAVQVRCQDDLIGAGWAPHGVVDLMPDVAAAGFRSPWVRAAFGIVVLLRLARGRPAFPARSLRAIDPTRVGVRHRCRGRFRCWC